MVVDGALYSEVNIQKLAYVPMKMLTRVPPTFGERAHSNYLPYVMKLTTTPSVLDLHLLASYKETSDTPVSQSYV